MNKKAKDICNEEMIGYSAGKLIWKEAQKELLLEFQKEMYNQNVGYICDFEIQYKLEQLSLDTNKENKK